MERVDSILLNALLERDIIPVIPPLGCDGEGHTFRLNSDAVAVEVARALHAVKLIYLSSVPGIQHNGELLRQLTVEQADSLLNKHWRGQPGALAPESNQPTMLSKLEHAVRAAQGGVPHVHIIDGGVEEGLLAEVFSHEGVGTLVYTNEYQAIRRARKKDARAIFALIKNGMENDELMRRSRGEIERQVEDFYVFEVDSNPVACAALHFFPDAGKAELACLCVDPNFENQGIGAKLMQYAEAQARAGNVRELFCLSTQAFNYFVQKGGFSVGTPEDLPPARRERYDRSGRLSQVLTKKLQ